MKNIHPTAVVEIGARIASTAFVGPFCYIGRDVVIGPETKLISHVTVMNSTKIGNGVIIYPNAVLGREPIMQNKRDFMQVRLFIGDSCIIGEGVTIHGAEDGTFIGHNCTLMPNSHVGHDCNIGNNVIITNNVMIGGHCVVEEFANLGGGAAIHQFVHIGAYAMVQGTTGVAQHVMPYMMAASCGSSTGVKAKLRGVNTVGLQRANFSADDILLIKDAYMHLCLDGTQTFADKLSALQKNGNPIIQRLVKFVKKAKEDKRGLVL